MVDCTIIIVNWNVRDYLRECLASLARMRTRYRYEIIVVDNASTDESLAMLSEEYPSVRVIALDQNVGFARANNTALGKASGRYIFFLNPDTSVSPDALEKMLQCMERPEQYQLVAPRIVNTDGTFQEGSVRRDPTVASLSMILLKLQHVFSRHPALQRYYAKDFDPLRPQAVEQPMGAALLVRRETLDKVGFFDEGFFIWFEEVDLCKRIRDAGGIVWYLPEAAIIHHGGKSFAQSLPLDKQRIFNASAIHYASKHFGFFGSTIIRLCAPISIMFVLVLKLFGLYDRRK